MYSLFTIEEEYNFTAQYGVVDYVFNIKGLSSMAKNIYQILLGELKYLHHCNKLKIDDKGIYVEMARSVIGEKVEMCAHTVAKRIKELQRHGLLIDRRMGLKLCNRIYLTYRTDAKRYMTDNLENKNGQKNCDVMPASKETSQPLIQLASNIISQVIDESLPIKTINQMLILCKDNLDDLNAAVQNCFGRTPKVSHVAMLFDELKNKYYKKDKPKEKTKTPAKTKNRFTDIHKHKDLDFDKVEIADRLFMQRKLGEISDEEYKSKILELGVF